MMSEEFIPAKDDPNTPNAFKRVLAEGKCCICEGTLATSHLNIVQVDKVAKWKFPIWGNILIKDSMFRAMAIACDDCVDSEKGSIKQPLKFALELQEIDGITHHYYHDVTKLEDAPPITQKMVEQAEYDQAIQIESDMERDIIWDAITAVMPNEQQGAIAIRGPETAEEINRELIKQARYYVMLISRRYIKGLQDPYDPQHHNLLTQIETAKTQKKKFIVVRDIQVSDASITWLKAIHLKGANIVEWLDVNFRKGPETTRNIQDALKRLGIV